MTRKKTAKVTTQPTLEFVNMLNSQLRIASDAPVLQEKTETLKRVTKAEKKIRIGVVRDWILSGCTSDHIVQLSAEVWDIRERQARKYISEATALIDAYVVDQTEQAVSRAVQEREMIKRKAIASGELYVAMDAIKDTAKLLGLYKPDEMTLKLSPELAMLMRQLSIDPAQMLLALQKQLEAKVQAHGAVH